VTPDGERLATVEAVLRELRDDMSDLKTEMARTRTRLHNVEGVASAFVDTQKQARRGEAAQYRSLEIRIQVLTIVVGLAAVLTPLALFFITGR